MNAQSDLDVTTLLTTQPATLDEALVLIDRQRALIAADERDPAYGLLKVRALERRAQHADATMAVILIDIDGFNRLNQLHGDTAMDARVRDLFTWLHAHLRSGDLFCRYRSGDELAALVPLDDATGVAQKAQAALHQFGMSGSIVVQPFSATFVATMEQALHRLHAARGASGGGWRGTGWRDFIVTAEGTRIGGVLIGQSPMVRVWRLVARLWVCLGLLAMPPVLWAKCQYCGTSTWPGIYTCAACRKERGG